MKYQGMLYLIHNDKCLKSTKKFKVPMQVHTKRMKNKI